MKHRIMLALFETGFLLGELAFNCIGRALLLFLGLRAEDL